MYSGTTTSLRCLKLNYSVQVTGPVSFRRLELDVGVNLHKCILSFSVCNLFSLFLLRCCVDHKTSRGMVQLSIQTALELEQCRPRTSYGSPRKSVIECQEGGSYHGGVP